MRKIRNLLESISLILFLLGMGAGDSEHPIIAFCMMMLAVLILATINREENRANE